jgi:hypothetical protein
MAEHSICSQKAYKAHVGVLMRSPNQMRALNPERQGNLGVREKIVCTKRKRYTEVI